MGSRLGRSIVLASWASLAGACGGASGGLTARAEADGGAASEASCALGELEDPDFAGVAGWSAVGGATLAPGGAAIDVASMCAHGGVEQRIAAPPASCASPVVLDLDVTLMNEDKLSFVVGVNGGWTSPVIPLGVQSLQICLGASVFGGAADLFLGMGNNTWLCPASPVGGPSLSIDGASLTPDLLGACPLPGTVPNGDFERGAEGWKPNAPGGVAEVAAGLGEGGSSAGHLATMYLCDAPSLAGTISLPTSAMVPNPALRIWSRGSSNAIASVRVGSPYVNFYPGATYLRGTGQATVANVCLPRWAQGTVQPIGLSFVGTMFTQECTQPNVRDFVLDGLSFVSEPACATDANIFDPGFEQAATASTAAPFWSLERYDDDDESNAELPVDPSRAHSGLVAARLSASTPCPHASLSGSVTVPSPDGANGPALKFWYEADGNTHTALGVGLDSLSAPLSLTPSTYWRQITACLDPRLATRPDLLRFSILARAGGTCADTFPTETIGIDDVELTTDATCPAL